MAQRILIGVIGLLVMTSTAAAAVPHLLALGVSTELAAWRARHYHNVRYVIDAAVDERADRLQGRITISLSIKGRQDLILDWRSAGAKADDAILPIVLNGRRFDAARLINGHLVISSSALRRGKNVVEVDFAAPIASTGTAPSAPASVPDMAHMQDP